jgi:hypothetical protein
MTGLDHVTLSEILARALPKDPAARFAWRRTSWTSCGLCSRASAASRRAATQGVPEGAVPLPLDHSSADAAGNDAAAGPAVDVALPESPLTAVPAPHAHDPSDLPLDDCRGPGAVPDRVTRRPRSVIAPIEPESPSPATRSVLQGPTWRAMRRIPCRAGRSRACSSRSSSACREGSRLGYWFAWRSALREHPALATQAVEEALPTVRVEEPQVEPEPATAHANPVPPAAAPADTGARGTGDAARRTNALAASARASRRENCWSDRRHPARGSRSTGASADARR